MLDKSPFEYLNLRRNPFGELTRQERAELAIVDIDALAESLTDPRSVLQLIGPCGHGKTTHLLAIEQALPAAEYIYFPEDGPRPVVSNHRPLIVDEAQRMSWWRMRAALKRGGPLVFGTHVDFSQRISRAGMNVRTIEVAAQASPQHLMQILNRRIDASRMTPAPLPSITEEYAVRLQLAFGADIRAIEHYLYDQFQRCASEQRPWPPVR